MRISVRYGRFRLFSDDCIFSLFFRFFRTLFELFTPVLPSPPPPFSFIFLAGDASRDGVIDE